MKEESWTVEMVVFWVVLALWMLASGSDGCAVIMREVMC